LQLVDRFRQIDHVGLKLQNLFLLWVGRPGHENNDQTGHEKFAFHIQGVSLTVRDGVTGYT